MDENQQRSEGKKEGPIILALTDGVGAEFGREARHSYFRQLENLRKNSRFNKLGVFEKQSLEDLLALAAFYQTVITPLRSSSNFVGLLKRSGSSHLRVGKDKLDKKFSDKSDQVKISFQNMLLEFQLSEGLLSYATLDEFVKKAVRHFKLMNDESMDR